MNQKIFSLQFRSFLAFFLVSLVFIRIQAQEKNSNLGKTKENYKALRREFYYLDSKIRKLERILETKRAFSFSDFFYELFYFTEKYRVWFGAISLSPPRIGNFADIEAFSASRDLNIPNDYRINIVGEKWWNTYFQEDGINNPSYSIERLPTELYQDKFYHTFDLKLFFKKQTKTGENFAETLELRSEKIEEIKKEIALLENKIEERKRQLLCFQKIIMTPEQLEDFYYWLRRTADELEIPPFDFAPHYSDPFLGLYLENKNKVKEINEMVKSVKIDFRVSVPYQQAFNFINRIEQYPYLLGINSLTIKAPRAIPPALFFSEPAREKSFGALLYIDIELETCFGCLEKLSKKQQDRDIKMYSVPKVKSLMDRLPKNAFTYKVKQKTLSKEALFAKATKFKNLMITKFQEGLYKECVKEYEFFVEFLEEENQEGKFLRNPELKLLVEELRFLKERARLRNEFFSLPIKFGNIRENKEFPQKSAVLVNGKFRLVDDYLDYGIRILEIKKSTVIFYYRGETITKFLPQ